MKIPQKAKQGFTLIELLLAIALFTLFLVIAVTGLLTIMQIFAKTSIVKANQQAGRYIIDDINHEASFGKSITLVDTSIMSPSGSTDAQGSVSGLCIYRNDGSQAFYFMVQGTDFTGNYGSQHDFADAQRSQFFNGIGVGLPGSLPGITDGLNSNFFATKTLYKGTTCTSTSLATAKPLTGVNSGFDGVNVQYFSVTDVTTTNEYTGRSFLVGLMLTQKGPSAGLQSSNRNQFDDSVILTSTIYPSLLPS